MGTLIGVDGGAPSNSARRELSYNSYEALTTALNAMARKTSIVGKSIFIVTPNVPDLWISNAENASVPYTYVSDAQFIVDMNAASVMSGYGLQIGYYRVLPLEGVKVDISGLLDLNAAHNYTELQKATGRANIGAAPDFGASQSLPATLADNMEYRIGTISALTLPPLPATGKYGIKIVFTASGSFTPTTTDTIKGDALPTTEDGKTYEMMFSHNGANWVLNWLSYA